MRWLFAIALLISSSAFGAFTERYVTQAAGGGGVGTEGDPWTLAEGFSDAVAGDRVNIKSDGAYSLGSTSPVANGTAVSLIVYRGYNSSIGDLEGQGRNADGSLDTTNFPEITLTGTLIQNARTVLQNLSFTGSVNSWLVGSTSQDVCTIISCSITNTANHASAFAYVSDTLVRVINSDLECTGATHHSLMSADADSFVIGCRFTANADVNLMTIESVQCSESVFIGNNTGAGINVEDNDAMSSIVGCTFYDLDEAIKLPNEAGGIAVAVINCHATDNTKYLDNLYSGTANVAVIEINDRTRDNTTPRTGIGDGVLIGEITTDTGGQETDYVNAGADNYRLISGAPGESAGMIEYSDIGAFQREPSAGGGGGGGIGRAFNRGIN